MHEEMGGGKEEKMSVLVKGMEMPKSCSACPMLDWDLDYIKCKVTGRHFKVKEEPFGARRVDDCPLVPVPPHGRLIDADALRQTMYHEAFETDSPMQKWDSGCWIRYKMFENAEETAPTIIPTDKDNDVLGKEEGE